MPYFCLLIKVLFVAVFAIATRGTLPRYRFDQLTQLNWKHLIFIYLIFLLLLILNFLIWT
jgi:NADH:ubiquinone oxidoreductase subunit H